MACARCLFVACICDAIPRVVTRTRVVIVRHRLERHRSSNSGRLAHLALVNSEIVDYGDGPMPALPRDGAWLLFPTGEPTRTAPSPPPRTLVVLDATWSQARRMYRKLDTVRGLPALHLAPASVPTARLRASPGDGRISTIEAIAHALRLLEDDGDAAAASLDAVFGAAVRAARIAGRRGG